MPSRITRCNQNNQRVFALFCECEWRTYNNIIIISVICFWFETKTYSRANKTNPAVNVEGNRIYHGVAGSGTRASLSSTSTACDHKIISLIFHCHSFAASVALTNATSVSDLGLRKTARTRHYDLCACTRSSSISAPAAAAVLN